MKQLVLDLIPAPAPTLANFVVGRNQEAYAVVTGLLGGSEHAGARVVYLWGEKGSGKTHLLTALIGDVRGGFTTGLPADDDLTAGGYVVDDVEALNDDAQQTLFNLMNRVQMSGGVVVATGDSAPRDLTLRRDLASRLGSGLVFRLQPLSELERADALRVHARTRGFALREDVIGYLLRHARRDMATLMSTLDALDAYSIETGREITLPLLKEVSQPMLV